MAHSDEWYRQARMQLMNSAHDSAYARPRASHTCAHCGGEALGYATVTYEGRSARVCHHETRDCYEAITVWGEILGIPGIRPQYVQ